MAGRDLALGQEGVPATGEQGQPMAELIELRDMGDRAAQELAVVAHDRDRRRLIEHPPLQTGKSVEIEIVGRFVQQIHVEVGEQQRGESDSGRLATRQRGHRLFEQSILQAELGPHRPDPRVEVGAAQRQPAIERIRVAIVGAEIAPGKCNGGAIQLGRGRGDPRAPTEELTHGFVVTAFGLLGEIADRCGRRHGHDGARIERLEARQHAQQGGLAHSVRADEAHTPSWRELQLGIIEHDRAAERQCEVAGMQRGGRHEVLLKRAGAFAARSERTAIRMDGLGTSTQRTSPSCHAAPTPPPPIRDER